MEDPPNWIYPVQGANYFRKPWSFYDGKIPFIMEDLIKTMDAREGYKSMGIFREKDSNRTLNERVQSLDAGEMREFPEEDTPILLACVLKNYIQGISEFDPLISEQATKELYALVPQDMDDISNLPLIQKIIQLLDDSHRIPLSYLFWFLHKITQHSESQMGPSNIGIVMSVVMFPLSDPTLTGKNRDLVAYLVQHFTEIFDPQWYSEDKFLTEQEMINLSMPCIDINDMEIEVQRRAVRNGRKIPIDYEYMDSLLGLKYPSS